MFQAKVLTGIETHILLCSVIFVFENCAMYEILW